MQRFNTDFIAAGQGGIGNDGGRIAVLHLLGQPLRCSGLAVKAQEFMHAQ